jgi:hypothetical protein
MAEYITRTRSDTAAASKTNARVGLIIRCSPRNSTATAPPPAFVFASADSAVLAFAPALLARRRRLVRFGCRLVGIVVEFDRAIGHQRLAVGVFEVRFGERRRRLARTALVGVPPSVLPRSRSRSSGGQLIDIRVQTLSVKVATKIGLALIGSLTSVAAAKTNARRGAASSGALRVVEVAFARPPRLKPPTAFVFFCSRGDPCREKAFVSQCALRAPDGDRFRLKA